MDPKTIYAADEKPLKKGQTVYGLSDGKAWKVGKISPDSAYPVICRGKALRAEWLTHEKPEG